MVVLCSPQHAFHSCSVLGALGFVFFRTLTPGSLPTFLLGTCLIPMGIFLSQLRLGFCLGLGLQHFLIQNFIIFYVEQ